MELSVEAGEVWWAEPAPVVGREQGGRRLVVVVSGAAYNEAITTLALVVPVTTRDRAWPNHVRLAGPVGLAEPLWAMTEQVRTVSRARLLRRAGLVEPACLAAVLGWVRDHLA